MTEQYIGSEGRLIDLSKKKKAETFYVHSGKSISLEFQKVIDAIEDWINANDRKVSFVTSFYVYGKDIKDLLDKDNFMCNFGPKDACKYNLLRIRNQLKKEKGNFVG